MENKGNKPLKKKPWEMRLPMKKHMLRLKECEILKNMNHKYCKDVKNMTCTKLELEIFMKCPKNMFKV
jgi:hypothetical protein